MSIRIGTLGVASAAGRGISQIAKTGTEGNVDTYTITFSDNTTSTFTVTNGTPGVVSVVMAGEGNAVTLGEYSNGTITLTKGAAFLQASDIIDDVAHTDTNKALSANMGKTLNDRITNLDARGRFLSVWNATTGKPSDLPADIATVAYTYKTGDYFIVGTAGSKVPTGTNIAAGTTMETFPSADGDTSSVNDTIVYSGSAWILYHTVQPTVSFSALAGQPSENANLATALNAKANSADLGAAAAKGVATSIASGSEDLITSGAVYSAIVAALNADY